MPVILHLNAAAPADWAYWGGLLKEQPQIRYVAKEFQTGLARLDAGKRALEDLLRLQDSLGRSLHPIIIGGGRHSSQLRARFETHSIVDAVPFLRTMHRHELRQTGSGRMRWQRHETGPGKSLHDLLAVNICRHAEYLSGEPTTR